MAAGQALVKEAMTHLKMRKGATLAQIRQQIESNYSGKIDVKKRGLLTTALKGLLEKGQVEKKGANYKLARVAKLKDDEKEVGVLGRRRRRKRHVGGRRRPHRRRHRRRRSRHHQRRRHHRRRGGITADADTAAHAGGDRWSRRLQGCFMNPDTDGNRELSSATPRKAAILEV